MDGINEGRDFSYIKKMIKKDKCDPTGKRSHRHNTMDDCEVRKKSAKKYDYESLTMTTVLGELVDVDLKGTGTVVGI